MSDFPNKKELLQAAYNAYAALSKVNLDILIGETDSDAIDDEWANLVCEMYDVQDKLSNILGWGRLKWDKRLKDMGIRMNGPTTSWQFFEEINRYEHNLLGAIKSYFGERAPELEKELISLVKSARDFR